MAVDRFRGIILAGMVLLGSSAHACSAANGGEQAIILHALLSSRVLWAICVMLAAFVWLRRTPNIPLAVSLTVLATTHPTWYVSPWRGDCGGQTFTTSLIWTIAAGCLAIRYGKWRSRR